MDVLRAVIERLSVDIHHVIEAAGIVVLGLVFYSYARRWLDSNRWIDARLRALTVGLVFGVLTIALMISRIEVGQGTFVAAAYRASLGGAGAPAGVAGLLATAGAAALALQWARRSGGVRSRHGFVLGAAVCVITLGTFLMLGAR